MTSQINPNNIDGNYPVAGVPNNTQGMRDNFTAIKTNFQYAENEIDDLQSKALLKAALTGTTLDNNMADNLIYAAKIQDFSATLVQITTTSGSIAVDYSAGHYQTIVMAGNISLSFTNFPAAGSVGMMRLQITVDAASRTLTLPAAVSVGTTGVQGYSANVITFATDGVFEFGFVTYDGGTTITLFDLNRPLSYYTNNVTMNGNLTVNGDIFGNVTLTDITASTVSASGNITGGNLRTAGLITATGNITGGNILGGANVNATTHTGTTVSVSANITGGNILFGSGVVSGTGNVIGGNVLSSAVVSAVGAATILSGTAVPAGGTTGSGYKFSSTANLGVFFGSGAPTLTAAQGSLYLNTTGSGTANRMYVNTNGSTGWTAVTTAT